ncbi:hypothetical protein QR680_016843 [Steinernema hermaphroditum]|uniref:G-protein coupled receptors family 1 profile domain-containing protein n=1 Tax=Steinernema hermaphroditum TaxID=289476 RepID=A0AA39LN99_9BILA|nr:hypothetical protein QR680_016843 [Steinernema hermaphroditum]
MNLSATVPSTRVVEMALGVAEVSAYGFGLLFGCYFLFRLKSMQLINRNLRWIMSFFMLSYMIVALVRSAVVMTSLIAQQDLNSLIGFSWCLIPRTVSDTGVVVFHLSIPAMALDRVFATLYPVEYSHGTHKRLGLRLSCSMVVIGGFYAIGFAIFDYLNWWTVDPPSFELIFTSTLAKAVTNVAFFVVYFMSSIVLFILIKLNAIHRKFFVKVDLNTRYQYRENETTLVVLAPIVAFYGLAVFPAAVFGLLHFFAFYPPETNVLFQKISNLLFALYGPFFAVSFVLAHRHFRRHLKTDLLKISCRSAKWRSNDANYTDTEGEATASSCVHFKELIAHWSRIARRDVTRSGASETSGDASGTTTSGAGTGRPRTATAQTTRHR